MRAASKYGIFVYSYSIFHKVRYGCESRQKKDKSTQLKGCRLCGKWIWTQSNRRLGRMPKSGAGCIVKHKTAVWGSEESGFNWIDEASYSVWTTVSQWSVASVRFLPCYFATSSRWRCVTPNDGKTEVTKLLSFRATLWFRSWHFIFLSRIRILRFKSFM